MRFCHLTTSKTNLCQLVLIKIMKKQYDLKYTATSFGHAYIEANSEEEAIGILERGEAENIQEIGCDYKFVKKEE